MFPAGCFALIGFASDDLAIAPERGVRDAITAHPRLVDLEGLPVNPHQGKSLLSAYVASVYNEMPEHACTCEFAIVSVCVGVCMLCVC